MQKVKWKMLRIQYLTRKVQVGFYFDIARENAEKGLEKDRTTHEKRVSINFIYGYIFVPVSVSLCIHIRTLKLHL